MPRAANLVVSQRFLQSYYTSNSEIADGNRIMMRVVGLQVLHTDCKTSRFYFLKKTNGHKFRLGSVC